MSSTITLSVPEISCDHCKVTIEGAVSELADVDRVIVDVPTKTVAIDGGARDAIVNAIEEVGFDVA